MKKKFDFIESAMHHRQIVILLVALLSLLGIYGLLNMPKNEFPDFTVRQGLVIGVYPGATSEEVETQLAQPLEKFLWSFKEIKKRNTYSQSRNGIVYIFVELNDNIKDKDAFWNRFKHGLAQFKSQLPQGVAALIANDDFGDTSAMLLTLESDSKTYHELEDQLNRLTDQLRTIESISNLRTYGLQKEQIGVYIDRDKLSAYGLNSATLLSTLFSQGFTTTSGSVDNGKLVAPIHISESYTQLNDLRQQIVYSDPQGHVIRLSDIATLKREYPDPSSYIKNNGKKSVMLSMEMNKGYNIVQFGTDVNKVLTQYEKTLPKDIHVYKITDQSQVVGDSVINFLKELLIAIIAVIIVIMLLLPMRVASVAASTIPITIFISLGLFYIGGIELNTVTLAALIITLGMIVDNSIVIIDCCLEKLDQGVSRWHAASASAKEFIGSIFSATLAISITFFPFLFTLKGMFQDFVKLFPIAVTLILTISLLVAILLVPYMQYYFIRKGIKKDSTKPQRKTILDYIQQTYEKVLSVCFKHPFYTIECGVLILILGIILFIHLPQRLMPIAERNQFAVEFYLPTGTAIERTTAVADSLEHILRRDSRVVSVTSFLGEGSPRFQTSYAPGLPGSNFAQFIVNTESTKATEELLDEYAPKYTNYFPEAWVRFKQLEYSDATSPIEVRFTGEDLTALRAVGDSTLQLLRQNPKLTLVRSNFLESTSGFYVDLKEDETNRLGIPKTLVSMNLATRFGDGLPLTTLWEGDYPVSVMLKDNYTGKQSSQSLENTQISGLLPGLNVPLRQIADIKPDWTDGQIVRRNGIRTLSILADVTRGTNVNQTSQEISAQLKQHKYPEGVTFSMGGQMEKDGESLPQLVGGLAIAIGIIFMILLFHFRKINLALLILFSLLLALPGTAIGILVMGQAMSLTGVLGVVSLMGIIVRNGIIMIDYAEELRTKEKLPAKLAAMQSASRRMRPIFLTSAAASMGVIPMIISRDPMWGPMGTVVCFGTIISMVLIITLLPVAYWLIFRIADAKKKKRNLKKQLQ